MRTSEIAHISYWRITQNKHRFIQ